MNPYQCLMYAVMALWLAPGSLWRPVALALLLQWAIGEAIYMRAGVHVPVAYYFFTDIAVCVTALLWRSHPSDLWVISVYPVVWFFYTKPDNWYPLYWIAVIQFIMAGPWPQLQNALSTYTHGPRSAGAINAKRGS